MIQSGYNFAHAMTAYGMCKIVAWSDQYPMFESKMYFSMKFGLWAP